MESVEQNTVAVPIAVPPPMLNEREIHRLARCIKAYVAAAAEMNRKPGLVRYFGNSALVTAEAFQLATRVLESDPQGEFGPALWDGSNWPCSWPKNGGALIEDIQSFTVAAVALLTQEQPAGCVDPSLLG
ncbi:hypothetical protein NW768_008448 [Fusarium equiseti]|uniref:DUF551 domain-containing protein n=1 Tax=Fusarium equiseti TaxID=61235 RepID=A0ABQ8R789_FUSEQ|nr:hypothetical protein NW768_008448 [Fusarium equiseti]